MTVAEAFARALRAAGVERVYGLPGEDHLRVLDALAQAGVRYVPAREESAAVMMAATDAQATGRPGVVVVTLAPGITNAMNGIAHAWLDGVPVLIVTGQHQPERAPVIIRQGLDTHALVRSLTKWTTVASPRIHQVLARGLETALAPRPGPVLLELREDVAGANVLDRAEDWPLLQSTLRSLDVRSSGVRGLPSDVSHLVAGSRAPAVVVGGNCPIDSPTRDALSQVAAELRAPVFTSPSAMGVAAPNDAWFAGTFMNGNLEADVLSRCDLLLTVGLDAKDFFNAAWRYTVPVIAVNEHPDTQRFAPTQYQLLGPTASTLASLAAAASASTWTVDDVTAYRATMLGPFHVDADAAFTIPAALRAARRVLPADTLLAVDAGFGKPLTSYLWSAPAPNQYFTAHGLSTMGYAIPAANALSLAHPDRPVAAFMGDGSLLMRATEISVGAEHRVAPIYVAWMDQALAQIETKQLRQGLRTVGARLPDLSCAKIADAFGGQGCDVDSLDDFCGALTEAMHSRVPTLIGARVDQSRRREWYELLRG